MPQNAWQMLIAAITDGAWVISFIIWGCRLLCIAELQFRLLRGSVLPQK